MERHPDHIVIDPRRGERSNSRVDHHCNRAHRLSAHRFLDRKVGGPPLCLPGPDVPSAVVLGHPAPRSVRFGNGQGVLAAFGEHRAVLADAFGARFAPRPVPTTLPLWREEQRRLDVPARPQDAPISPITVGGRFRSVAYLHGGKPAQCSAHERIYKSSDRSHSSHSRVFVLRTCHRGNPFANNILHNQSGRSLQVQVPSQNLRRATVITCSTKRPQRCRRGDVEIRDQCPTERCGVHPEIGSDHLGRAAAVGAPTWGLAPPGGATPRRPTGKFQRLLITPNQTRTAGRRHVRL